MGVVDEDGFLVLYNTLKTGSASVVKSECLILFCYYKLPLPLCFLDCVQMHQIDNGLYVELYILDITFTQIR